MPYNYQALKPKILTDEGQRVFLQVRDKVKKLLEEAGAFRMENAMPSGDSWTAMAYVDRMVELNEIREITGSEVAAQHRVFVARG